MPCWWKSLQRQLCAPQFDLLTALPCAFDASCRGPIIVSGGGIRPDVIVCLICLVCVLNPAAAGVVRYCMHCVHHAPWHGAHLKVKRRCVSGSARKRICILKKLQQGAGGVNEPSLLNQGSSTLPVTVVQVIWASLSWTDLYISILE
jgi:hypothetical protein